jgi:hypothetical protein
MALMECLGVSGVLVIGRFFTFHPLFSFRLSSH